jgi:DNA-binding transcriptional LysR family regulator
MSRLNAFDLGDLRAFVAVAELGRFGAAARAIHISQPALSRRIEKLEEALGVRLLDRTTRRVQLTALGHTFGNKARALLDELERSVLEVAEGTNRRRGEVTVACIASLAPYLLPPVLVQYRQRFPGIFVRIIDDDAKNVLAAVVNREADFGIDIEGLHDPRIDFRPIYHERFVAVVDRKHGLADRRSVTWSELKGQRLMAIDKSNVNRLLLDSALVLATNDLELAYETRTSSTLIGLVEAGLGIAILPELTVTAKKHGGLIPIPLTGPVVRRRIGLISAHGNRIRPHAQQLFDLIRAVYRGARPFATSSA